MEHTSCYKTIVKKHRVAMDGKEIVKKFAAIVFSAEGFTDSQ
jgi:hypothetical protein